jgi:hypothetical protein
LLKNQKLFNNKIDFLILIIKIAIISFGAFSVIENFIPFYEGSNPYYVGASAVKFAQNEFVVSNELLEKYGGWEFAAGNWFVTNQNTSIPGHSAGLIFLGYIFYLIGGYYGLFYLSPIFFIILLIISERITTKFFGNIAGLITLLILVTSNLLYRVSIELMTESVFTVFLILGIYFTINFAKTRKKYQIILASTLFAYSTWIRMTGFISFPIEIIFVILYFIIVESKKIKKENRTVKSSKLFLDILKKVKGKKAIKVIILLSIPWIILIAGNMLFFSYFFDDPTTNYLTIEKQKYYDSSTSSLIKFESKDFENIKQYSKYLLPYQIPGTYNKIDSNLDEHFGENWPGLVGLSFLFFITFVSIKTKDHRFHIILFMIFIISYVWFYSAITWEERSEGKEIPARYMIPAFVLSSFMIGFITEKILKFTVKRKKLKVSLTIIKSLIIFGLILFFIIGFYFHPSIQNVGGDFKNHENYSERYPLDFEGIEPNSIILSHNSIRVLEYNGLISFDVMPLHENSVQKNSVELLKQLNDEGYDIFTFKKSFNYMGLEIKKTLIEEYNIILKNHSKTFCKVEFQISDNLKSDKECLDNEPIRIPYFMK